MKSIRNHLSLVIALLSILFSIQTFVVVQRAIEAYQKNLSKNYSIVVVSKKNMNKKSIIAIDSMILEAKELSADNVIKRLNTGISSKNIELLKLTLPRFYKLKLSIYPTPKQIEQLTKKLLSNSSIIKVENFSKNHNTVYKLLLLFKNVIFVFAIVVFTVTILLIFKELRIWQFNHSERMNVMGLFGSPTWLRSAVLFRLAIVDALIASFLAFLLFSYLSTQSFILNEFTNIGITITIFDKLQDSLVFFGTSLFLSVMLATLIVLGHKEEV